MNNNEKKYKLYKKNKIINYIILFLSIGVIVLEVLALFKIVDMLWGIILFVIILLLKKFILK